MQQTAEDIKNRTQKQFSSIHKHLEEGTLRQTARLINSLRPVEIARLLESSPPPARDILWDMVDKDTAGEVLEELSLEVQTSFLQDMDAEDLVELTEGLDTDDQVDILQQLPETVVQEVLSAMSDQDRARVEVVMSYDEDTAGGLANTDTITVRPRFTLDVVLRYLRRHDFLPPSTDALIVVNRKDEYLGLLPISTLLTSDPNLTVREVMVTETNAIQVSTQDTQVAKLFEQHDWISAPVVNEQGKLIGRITIDDVVDVIREDADHSLMSMAGLDEEEDTFATVAKTAPRRAVWLGINLLTAILASAVVNIFEGTIDKVVALAVLMSIAPSMGGVAGSQTLTVVIRGMALGHIGRHAIVIGAAMTINLVTAALAGALLPVTLKALKIDPALAGGVTLTTITDVVGLFAFLGLATYFYG